MHNLIAMKVVFCIFITTLFLGLFFSCKQNKLKYPYSINDFSDSLQPKLLQIVSRGIVGETLGDHASEQELQKLTKSEHPVLRATALRTLIWRDRNRISKVIDDHLDDTAAVEIYIGEFGTRRNTVSDAIIYDAEWLTEEDMRSTMEKVVTEHNYLRAAFTALSVVDTNLKYYQYVKQMCRQERDYSDIEQALLALSRYKKPEDQVFIRETVEKNYWRMGHYSLLMIKDLRDTSYLNILEKCVKYNLHEYVCRNWRSFSPDLLFDAIAVFKSDRSAALLSSVLKQLPGFECGFDKGHFERALKYAIWKNKCQPYSALVDEINSYISKDSEIQERFWKSLPPIEVQNDSSYKPVISWPE